MCSQAPCPIALWCGLLLTSSQRSLAGWQRCCKGPRCPLKRSIVLELNVSPACCLHRYSCWYASALKKCSVKIWAIALHDLQWFFGAWQALPLFPKAFGPTGLHDDVTMTAIAPRQLSVSADQ